ncbi:hypothetical protein [Pedobacter rhodius]|uniref:Uncharacterized protein n=1 Tax=Pedobacter rhodius TaxID=3004098 RepID=A0ABT4KUH0_9SPHI|nr:hypothetical protein [Pedobacter sp. SJ11]MCZ4222570.1 hypothetical protein [Pedobacter sp. SJ11]
MTLNWIYFIGYFNLMLICSFFMSRCARYFYTYNKTIRKFSILDLQFPATPQSLKNLIEGIGLLEGVSKKVFNALRLQLIIDFFFMPGAYLSILFLCLKTASKSGPVGEVFFLVLAYAQLIAWFCDFVENVYLLFKIHAPDEMSKWFFNVYKVLEIAKWGLSSFGLFCSLSALLYFWLRGFFYVEHTIYLLVLIVEIVIFILANKLMNKPVLIEKLKKEGLSYHL